ncbi:caspase-8-like [Saccoglossus kowalevskii]
MCEVLSARMNTLHPSLYRAFLVNLSDDMRKHDVKRLHFLLLKTPPDSKDGLDHNDFGNIVDGLDIFVQMEKLDLLANDVIKLRYLANLFRVIKCESLARDVDDFIRNSFVLEAHV